jgi:tetratricopeptide (TPR) repeat protein
MKSMPDVLMKRGCSAAVQLAFLAGVLSPLCVRAQAPSAPELAAARQQLAAKNYGAAKAEFAAYADAHPQDATAQLGLGDAELGLHEYEDAELAYRRAVSIQPELWVAHKDLVLVEAKLGRWEEFDRERELLRGARERGAPNITARESDVIDSFEVGGKQWIVREYFEPVGRSEARYNFEQFSSAGRAEEYVSLEPAAAAETALSRSDQVKIGSAQPAAAGGAWELNWYTGRGHGTIKRYTKGEPKYEAVRADVRRWLNESRMRNP